MQLVQRRALIAFRSTFPKVYRGSNAKLMTVELTQQYRCTNDAILVNSNGLASSMLHVNYANPSQDDEESRLAFRKKVYTWGLLDDHGEGRFLFRQCLQMAFQKKGTAFKLSPHMLLLGI